MSTRFIAPGSDRVEVWQHADGTWRWVFRSGDDHTQILSNESYPSLEAALGSATIAYPGVRTTGVQELADGRAGTGRYVLIGFVGVLVIGVAALALAWWLARRRRRTR